MYQLMRENGDGQRYSLGDSLVVTLCRLAAFMIIDINGPDVQSVDHWQVKALILEAVNVWKNYKKRVPSRSSTDVARQQELTNSKQEQCILSVINP